MTILIIAAVLFAISLVVFNKTGFFNKWNLVAFIGCAVSGFVLAGGLLCLPLNHMEVNGKIARFEAVRASRDGGSEIEAAAWRMKVADCNAWLASMRYYNNTLFDIWIPDRIEQIEPIR